MFDESAKANQLSLDSLTIHRTISMKNQILRDALYDQIILQNSMTVSDSLARQHFLWMNTECYIKHLFSPHKEILDTMYNKLRIDPDLFPTYAAQLFSDSTLKHNGGLLGWIQYNDLDPSLEDVAFSMRVDSISRPTRSQHGWHILWKQNERKQMIISEEDYLHQKRSIMSNIKDKSQSIRANKYIQDLIESKNISIDDSLVYHSIGHIFTLIHLNQGQLESGAKIKYGDILSDVSQSLYSILSEPLAHYDGGTFTVQDFLDGLLTIKPAQSTHSPKTSFFHALRNKILVEEAINQELDTDPIVQLKMKDVDDQFLASAFLKTQLKENSDPHFSQVELKMFSDSLRSIYPVTVYPEHLEALFIQPN